MISKHFFYFKTQKLYLYGQNLFMIKKSNKYLLQCLFEKINYHYSGRTCKLETLVSEDSQEIIIYQSPFTNFHSENSVSDCLLFNLLRRQGPPATVTNWFGLDFFHLLFFYKLV